MEDIKSINITVPGNPTGKARHRSFINKKGNIQTYNTYSNNSYEGHIRWIYKSRYRNFMLCGAVAVSISAYKKTKVKSKIGAACTAKPDIDNIAKIVMDALSGFAYKDDSCVAQLVCSKMYSGEPRVEVLAWQIQPTAT
jgi:Holliday junction resolvase RusA-like endonuclease